jgi:hypothetical protein
MATAAIGDFAYLFGGYNGVTTAGTVITTAYKYQFSTNTYTAILSLPTATMYIGTAVGSDVYLMPQTATPQMIRYNVAANTYTTLATYGTTATNYHMLTIGTFIYIKQLNALYRYDTVANTYATLGAPPLQVQGFMGTDGTDIYMFGTSASYKYTVSSNTYTAILSDSQISIGTDTQYPIVAPLYIGPSGTTANINSIHFQFTISGNAFANTAQYRYNITSNTYSGGGTLPSNNRATYCVVPGQERIVLFSYNTSSSTPLIMAGAIAFTPERSPFTATGPGIAATYPTGQSLRNSTTLATGQVVSFKSGEVIASNASYTPVWGGAAVAAFDAIVIQKG